MAIKPTTTKTASNKLGQLVTPVGSALFVSSPKPSQFDANKEEASIILSADDYAKFITNIDTLIANYEGDLVVAKDKLKYPVKEATDKEGNLTGEMIVKAKTSINFPAKFYGADGALFTPTASFSVPNRSKIRLAVSVEIVSTSLYKGIVLRLNGIKIISATPWAGGNDPFAGLDDDGDFAYSSVEDSMGSDDSDWAE